MTVRRRFDWRRATQRVLAHAPNAVDVRAGGVCVRAVLDVTSRDAVDPNGRPYDVDGALVTLEASQLPAAVVDALVTAPDPDTGEAITWRVHSRRPVSDSDGLEHELQLVRETA